MLSPRPRRLTRRTGPVEQLEPRLLLATFFISGTGGADTWTIRAGTTGVTINGTFFSQPSTTAVQIDGLDGNDTVICTRATVPVVFNGGNHDDLFALGSSNVDELSALCTFNGGGQTDTAMIDDSLFTSNTTYSASGSQAERGGLGRIAWDASCENLQIFTGSGAANSIVVSPLSTAIATTIVGSVSGSESAVVDMAGSGGNVVFNGNSSAGSGVDSLQISDFNFPVSASYSVTETAVSRGSRIVQYSSCKSLSVQGTGNGSSSFNVSSINTNTPTSLLGWSSSDSFNVVAANASSLNMVKNNLTLTGFSGSDSFTFDDTPYAGSVVALIYVTPTKIISTAQVGEITYGGDIETITVAGPNTDSQFNVQGTSPTATGQTTIYAGGGSNLIRVFPYDPSNIATLPTHIGVFGQGGTDTVSVDLTATTFATNYTFSNPFGPGTCDIAGSWGAGLIGAETSVETVEVLAGSGHDTFNLQTFQSGNGLSVKGNGGNDVFNVGLSSGSLPTAISNMSAFNYVGGSGADELNIYNQNHAAAFSYLRSTSALVVNAIGYGVSLQHFTTETIALSAGAQADTFSVTSALFGQKTVIGGAGGLDNMAISDFVSGDVEFAVSQDFNALTLGQNARARMSATNGTAVYLRSLSIAAGARFDLRGNNLIYDWTGSDPIGSLIGSAYTGVTGMIQSGRNGGMWNGTGLITSNADALTGLTTLGVAQSRDVLGLQGAAVATWNGFTIDATCVLVKYTYGGDANLDGLISGDDYTAIDFNVATAGAFAYANGDFNYDGIISGDDYSMIDFNIVAQGPPLTAATVQGASDVQSVSSARSTASNKTPRETNLAERRWFTYAGRRLTSS